MLSSTCGMSWIDGTAAWCCWRARCRIWQRTIQLKPTSSWTNSPNRCSSTRTQHRWLSNAQPSSARQGIAQGLYFDLLCVLATRNIIDASMWTWKTCSLHVILSYIYFLYSFFRFPPVFRSLKVLYTAPPAGLMRPSRGWALHVASKQPEPFKITQTPCRLDMQNKHKHIRKIFNFFLPSSSLFVFHLLYLFSSWSAAGAGWLREDQKRPAGLQSSPGWDLCCVRYELAAGEVRIQRRTSPQNATQNLKAVTASAGGCGGKNLWSLWPNYWNLQAFVFLILFFLLHCRTFDFLYAKIILLTWLNDLELTF